MQELIAVRVKDGIFVGNITASQDHDFIVMNKITHIINCAGGELQDFFMDDGIKYLTFPWKDTPGSLCTAVMFDSADENVERTVSFIDEALEGGNCVLVHSYNGLSRSPALIVAYFIVKFGWKLDSALSFLEMAHKDMCIKPHFLRQLRMFANRNSVDRDVFDLDVDDSQFDLDNDQWMLRNTLLNGLTYDVQRRNELYKLCASKVELGMPIKLNGSRAAGHGKKGKRIVFIDTNQGTHINSVSGSPVVNAKSLQQLDQDHFIGFHGSVALRSRRRNDSIMSRSITPCNRRAESDPCINPRGRQELPVRSEVKLGRTASLADGTASSQVARTSSGNSTIDGGCRADTEYRYIAPPSTVYAHGRSPFATLASSHKYRKGSPLPAATHNKKGLIQRQRRSSVTDVNSVLQRSLLNSGSSRPARFALSSSDTLVMPRRSLSLNSTCASSRVSSYKNITPHRLQPSSGVLSSAWDRDKFRGPLITTRRLGFCGGARDSCPSSPGDRMFSSAVKTAFSNSGLTPTSASRKMNGGGGSSKKKGG